MYPPMAVLFVAAPIFVLVIVVGSIILVVRGRRGEAVDLCLAVLLSGSLITAATGLAQIISPLLSVPLGRGFTYNIPTLRVPLPIASGTAPSQEQAEAQSRAAVENDFRNDLVYGSTTLVAGLLLLGALAPARRVLRRQSGDSDPVRSTFFVMMLVTTTLASLSALIVAVSELIRRYIVLPVGTDANLPQPGGAIAIAIVFTPLWVFFVVHVLRESGRPA
jgi:hypothetical protein